MRVIRVIQLICYLTDKDLKDLERPDINKIVVYVRNHFAVKTQQGFILDVRYIWKRVLPEKDERGRFDETIVPYVVRHLSSKIDRSKQKLRQDKLTPEEFDKLLAYFSHDLRMQAYLSLALESLGRPQELLFRRLKDVEIHDNYAKIWISDHGKEGVGFLQCIDSFPYVMRWFNAHPFKRDKEAFLFINTGTKKRGQQMTPFSVNKKLRKACKDLKIENHITSYSIKRNGVTFARLRGDSDVQIQKRARWTTMQG